MARFRRYLVAAAVLGAGCSDSITAPPDRPAPSAPELPTPSFAIGPVSDGHGATWRQLPETVGLTWNQLAQICPIDGINPCWGSIGTVNLSGWVWATEAQVVELISHYEPAILTSKTLEGSQYGNGVNAFFAAFNPTDVGGCFGSGYIFTCSFGALASGWTSTSPSYGTAVAATILSGFGGLPRIMIGPEGNLGSAVFARGHFLWRANTDDGSAVDAVDDVGQIDSPHTGVVLNVLANDRLGAGPATAANVTITPVSSSHPGVSLSAADGAVSVAAGVPVGTVTLRYRICETARPSNCDAATVTVTNAGNIVDAVDDAGASKTGGGIAVANVLGNDTFAGGPATLLNVAIESLDPAGALSLQADGSVRVAAGTPAGGYQLGYRICEIANPTNCDQAMVRVTVSAYLIDAVDDHGSVPSNPGGTAVASVLTNDRFDNGPATLSQVALTLVSSSNPGVTLDLADGSVDVAGGIAGGRYVLTYQICEIASPSNCDQAGVEVEVEPQAYVVSADRFRVNEGSGGSFTVRLSQPPLTSVSVAVSYLAGTMPVTFSPSGLTFTPANWSTPRKVTFATKRDSGRDDNAGTLQLVAAGIAARNIVVSGLDKDRKSTNPLPIIQAPLNGQTVSGVVDFWGTATDSDGTVVDAKFYVESDRIATVAGNSGTYRPSAWNSASVANGWHTLEMRATDNAGNESRTTIKVLVAN